MKIERIDHLNITVADIDRSIEFYERVLGMRTERMGEGRAALLFGNQKIHLDLAGADGDERREADAGAYLLYHRGADHRDRRACRTLRRAGPDAGPRAGAIGTIQSVYIDDPDNHSIEISTY